MYFDLFLPFPIPEVVEPTKKKKDKGKGKQPPPSSLQSPDNTSCWEGLSVDERDDVAKNVALAGHLGYSVIGCTVSVEPSNQVTLSPFRSALPFPHLDPRKAYQQSSASGSSVGHGRMGSPSIVQSTRYHMRLDDSKTHCLTSSNTSSLKDYDILSVQPTSDKALQLACSDLCFPGPNQISIITLPLHEKPYHFRLNRKQIKQAQRNGVMFEIIYSPALFPPPSTSPETARRYRQNFMANAREVIRVTAGKNVIFSSGPGGSGEGMRGALDIVNLGTMLGMPANLAKDAVSLNPKRVLLNAQSRRTFKAIFSAPQMVPPPSSLLSTQPDHETSKRSQPDSGPDGVVNKRAKVV